MTNKQKVSRSLNIEGVIVFLLIFWYHGDYSYWGFFISLLYSILMYAVNSTFEIFRRRFFNRGVIVEN